MKTLTKGEEQVMQIVWKLNKGFLREVVNEFPDPKPHQNTIATILKILVEKEFVGIQTYGRLHQYSPLISKVSYRKSRLKSLAKKYFDGSFSNLVSSMVNDKNLSVEELEMLVKELKSSKK